MIEEVISDHCPAVITGERPRSNEVRPYITTLSPRKTRNPKYEQAHLTFRAQK